MKGFLFVIFYLIDAICFGSSISPNLTAEYNSRKKLVILKWQNTDPNVTGFVLQRSDDNIHWNDIYNLPASGFNKKKLEKYLDAGAAPAKNYYRLKVFSAGNLVEYTKAIMVIIGSPASSWIMFPVPVRDVLNLQYNGSDAIRGVVSIFIQNMYGYVLTRKRYSSLNRIIQVPVDNLGRGTYDIRIVINDEVVWNQRFIK